MGAAHKHALCLKAKANTRGLTRIEGKTRFVRRSRHLRTTFANRRLGGSHGVQCYTACRCIPTPHLQVTEKVLASLALVPSSTTCDCTTTREANGACNIPTGVECKATAVVQRRGERSRKWMLLRVMPTPECQEGREVWRRQVLTIEEGKRKTEI